MLNPDGDEAFDSSWYIHRYPDVSQFDMTPREHYDWLGKALGRRPNAHHLTDSPLLAPIQVKNFHAPFSGFGIIRHNPLVSVLIVSFNSSRDLKPLAATLVNQTYGNLEIILIENGHENTREIFQPDFPSLKYRTTNNVGFAEGNNLAMAMSQGELILLLNPDTLLECDTIQSLVDSLRHDENAAVSAPKINFFKRFINLRIQADQPFTISRHQLLIGLSYRKIFLRHGSDIGDDLKSSPEGLLEVDLPYETPREVCVDIHCATNIQSCTAQIGYSDKYQMNLVDGLRIKLHFNNKSCSSARYLVNNAGTGLHADKSPYDRGYAQYDDGEFFSKSYVPAFCGCVALIRRIAILNRTIFIGTFFAYYEDSELSHWLRNIGYRVLYQPQAIVYHRHSESTEENSVLWKSLVERSRAIYSLVTETSNLPLDKFSIVYPDELPSPLLETLGSLDDKIRSTTNVKSLYKNLRHTVCIYNSYFLTMGGGEKHALDIASIFQDANDVYLVSESDFDIDKLSMYFSVDLTKVRKLISTNVDTHFSSKFDIFINSTFRSNLVPAARDNFYIVSFPHDNINPELKDKYIFLHNSPYTREWANALWGEHRCSTILPIIGFNSEIEKVDITKKMKIITSVGRFNYDGHCKNQHLIIDAFQQITARHPSLQGWVLKIVGSCDFSQSSSKQYLLDMQKRARGYNIEVLPNVTRTTLDDIYAETAIYVHATGLEVPLNRPELHEHFGIACFEALRHGCLPVVYAHGGPALQIEGIDCAKTFEDVPSLCTQLLAAIKAFENGLFKPEESTCRAEYLFETNQKNLTDLSAFSQYKNQICN